MFSVTGSGVSSRQWTVDEHHCLLSTVYCFTIYCSPRHYCPNKNSRVQSSWLGCSVYGYNRRLLAEGGFRLGIKDVGIGHIDGQFHFVTAR